MSTNPPGHPPGRLQGLPCHWSSHRVARHGDQSIPRWSHRRRLADHRSRRTSPACKETATRADLNHPRRSEEGSGPLRRGETAGSLCGGLPMHPVEGGNTPVRRSSRMTGASVPPRGLPSHAESRCLAHLHMNNHRGLRNASTRSIVPALGGSRRVWRLVEHRRADGVPNELMT